MNKKLFITLALMGLELCAQIKTSIIIPCAHMHARHLYGLLRTLEIQTVAPDEIVISLSESHKVEPQIIDEIRNTAWSFGCKLLTSGSVQYSGKNRNIACSHATGDLFILQDADDIPHPKRIEIISHIFEMHNLDFLMHGYSLVLEDSSNVEFSDLSAFGKLKLVWDNNFDELLNKYTIANGNIALKKEIFQKLKWSETMRRDQDKDFNQRVYENYKNVALLDEPLLYYRQFLSSAPETVSQHLPQYKR